ncbi:S-layer homology domain-containing protein [Paenibacillus thalictri]|uniref:S-layer homology domain-containing protein n=1 Tax=Paenibacillus thalictri TaxID=2527873 RepID=UPI003B837F27
MSFTAPADSGGSAITGYVVSASADNITVSGTVSPITVTGLTNGKSYTFTVRAVNAIGDGLSSADSAAVVPFFYSSSSSGGSAPSAASEPANTGVNVLVNGKAENAGTATISNRNNQTVKTIVIDQKKLDDKLAAEGPHTVVTISSLEMKSDVFIGEINGQMVKNMENKQAVLQIKTDQATYSLPAQQFDIDSISDQVGKSVALQDIKVQIEIAVPAADALKAVGDAAEKGTFTLVAPPVNFTVRAIYGGVTIEVSKFNAYVERAIAIPDGADPGSVTTGVVVEPDGKVRHVPTKVLTIDGKHFAVINSLTNSTYSLIKHPLAFSDTANHWAKEAINDMGSRMVIDGTGGTMFTPDKEISRAEFAAIIVRGLGLKLEQGTSPFSDVKASDWFSDVINTAYAYHLIGGFEDGTFRPNEKITREEAMAIIAGAMKWTKLKDKLSVPSTGDIIRPFSDAAQASSWAQSSIAASIGSGIVSGRSGTQLAPKDYMTRAETAVMIQRLLKQAELI